MAVACNTTATHDIEISPKQVEYIANANHRWNFKIGATQCGKTFIDVRYVVPMRILERLGKPGLAVILGVTREAIERNVLTPMRDIWGNDNIGDIKSGSNIANIFGEKVYCLGAEKRSQVSKLRGPKFKYLYIDELVDINEEVFELVKSRLSLSYSCCDATGNPSYPTHFIKKFIDSDADIYCQKWTLFDNPFLDPQYIHELQVEYKGTVFEKRYIRGQWALAEGLIYKQFAANPKAYTRSWDGTNFPLAPKVMFATASIDFGGNGSAHAFTCLGFEPRFTGVGVLADERTTEELDATQLAARFVLFIRRCQARGIRITEIRADSEATVLIRTVRNALARAGIGIPVEPSIKGKILSRIDFFSMVIGSGRFFIMEDCVDTRIALEDAMWNPKTPDERLDDGTTNIDNLDSMEYAAEPYMSQIIDIMTLARNQDRRSAG